GAEATRRLQSVLIAGEGISNQSFIAGRRVVPASFPLGKLGFVYECSYCLRFHLVAARSGTLRDHDEARMVRRTEPSSRSFLVSVGREMPRMRAAALRFPPVRPIVVWMASSTIACSDFPSAGIRITPPAGVSTSGTYDRRWSERWCGWMTSPVQTTTAR